MVVNGCAVLSVSELLKVGISSSESLPSVEAVSMLLSKCGQVFIGENLATSASLLLLDITCVGPASDAHASEEKRQVTLSTVVPRVRLVPVGESAGVLASDRGLIAYLQVAIDTIANINR